MAQVTVRDLRKSYGPVPVIHGVDVVIEDGEFAVLVGPSGCGKSTLLRMIAGLESVTGGVIRIGERVVNNLPPGERDIAMVFQSYALYPHKTVRANMGFALKLRGTDKREIEARVLRAAEILGLAPYLERYPRQLSGGQRQRVAMGRAIVRDPKVFLFDEPLSNLDAKLRVAMRAEIKELHQRLRTTTVFVTHDQIEAMTMADKIVVMQEGRIEQVGAPLELYDRPVNRFVAEFIGSPAMNLIQGFGRDGGVEAHGVLLPVAGGAAAHGPVIYGIRPEHLELAEDGLPARVRVVEPTGAETLAYLQCGASEIVAVFRDRHDLAPGQQVHLRPRRREGASLRPRQRQEALMPERVVLCYGDSNTHGTAPMTSLEDRRRLGPLRALAGRARRRARVRLARDRGGAAGPHHRAPGPGRGRVEERPRGAAGDPRQPFPDRPGGADARHQRFEAAFPGAAGADRHLDRAAAQDDRLQRGGPGKSAPRILLVAPAPVVEEGSLAEVFAGGPGVGFICRRSGCGRRSPPSVP